MSDPEIAHFKKSEELFPIADQIFAEEKKRILSLIPSANVEHVGSSAIPGALTIGDLDIQVRIIREDFERTVENLKILYRVNHPELWTKQFALFKLEDWSELPMSIMVTVIDSKYDEFHRHRDLFKNNRKLLAKYNDLKRTYEGKSLQGYKKAKKIFFGPNGESRLLKDK